MDCDLLTVGETLISLTGLQLGHLEDVATFDKSIGGAESNTAIGVARLGLRSAWVSRVGDDGLGRDLITRMRAEDVDVRGVTRHPQPTGLMIKERRSPSDVHVHYYRSGTAASRLDVEDIDPDQITGARRLHITGVTLALGAGPRRAVRRAFELAAAAEVQISFDPNLRLKLWSVDEAVKAYQELFPYVTDLLCNEQEAMWLARSANIEDAFDRLTSQGFETVVVKRGERGVLGFRDDEVIALEARQVEAVDSVGAGDAFNAGYLFGQLTGLSFRSSLEVGNWAASHVVACLGDYEGFPDSHAYDKWAQGLEDDV